MRCGQHETAVLVPWVQLSRTLLVALVCVWQAVVGDFLSVLKRCHGGLDSREALNLPSGK